MPKITDLPDLATPQEVAEVLRCSVSYVQSECKAGRLTSSFIAGRFLITPDAVRDYLEGKRITCPEKTKARISSGGRNVNFGKFDGSNTDGSFRNQRALKTAKRLKEFSRNSSSEPNPPGRVIHLSA